jgi:8-oxo-dGTP diphosphatase
MSNSKIVVAGLIWREGRILICQRKPDDSFPDKWEFPGGKVEPGEQAATALQRELLEELGIRAKIGPELWRTQHEYANRVQVQLAFFRVLEFEGALRNRVFQQIRWVEPPQLASYDFLEADRPLITLLAAGKMPVPE